MQQWARRYLGYAQAHGAPLTRVLLRAYVHHGAERFRLSVAVEAMPLLLHTSVFLFFAGLIEFLFTINKIVAFFALGWVAVFAFIYAILTLAPNWRPTGASTARIAHLYLGSHSFYISFLRPVSF